MSNDYLKAMKCRLSDRLSSITFPMTDNKAVGLEVWEMICVIVSQKVKISLLIRQPALHKMSERFAVGLNVRRIRKNDY